MNDPATTERQLEPSASAEGWELVSCRETERGTVLIFTSTWRPPGRLGQIMVLSQTYDDALAEAQRRMRLYDDIQLHLSRHR